MYLMEIKRNLILNFFVYREFASENLDYIKENR